VPHNRIKLCEVTPHLGSGGIETRVSRVLSSLSRDEFDLTWLGFGYVDPALSKLAGRGVKIIQFEKQKAAWTRVDLVLMERMVRAFRTIQPDVVRVHNWSTSVYGIAAARIAGVPHIIYESAGRESPEGPGPVRRAAMRSLAPMVDVFLAVCPFLAKELAAEWNVPPSEVRAMPTGVDLDRFSLRDRPAVRARFGIPDDAFVVGTIGMFRPVKRVDDIVEAGVRLLARHPKAHLLVIGSDYDLKIPGAMLDVARHAGVSSRVHFPGRILGAENCISAFDVFVNASSFEGASNAIIEAMATGVPVIATDVGGNPDVVIDGKTGHLVRVASPDQIHAAMERLITDRAHAAALGAASQQTARARHTIEGMTSAYLQIFRSLAEDRTRGLRHTAAKVLARRARRLDL